MTSIPESKITTRRLLVIAASAVCILAALAVYYVYSGNNPAPVDINTAVRTVEQTETDAQKGTIDGIWVVDTQTGEFTFDDATGSFAGFRVDEVLTGIGDFTAVGRTGDITGLIKISEGQLVSADMEVNLRTLTSNKPGRDGAVQRILGTAPNPTATFSLTENAAIPEDAAADPVEMTIEGQLTVNGITNDVSVEISSQQVNGLIVVVGHTEILFSDYSLTIPEVPAVLSAEDHGIMEFQLLLKRSE